MKKIQGILKEVLAKEGLTLYRVSKDLHIDYASLYRSLHDKGDPKWSTVEKVLRYLGYELQAVNRRKKKMRP